MDTFDDIFAPVTTNVRAGGKFQPKGKQRPQKIASVPATSSMVLSDTKEENSGISDATCSNAGLSVLSTSVAGDRLDVPDGACLASFGVSGIGKTLIKCEELVSRVPEGLATSGEPKSEVVVGKREDLGQEGGVKTTGGAKGDDVGCSGSRAPESEVDFVGIDADHFIDSSSEPSSSNDRVTSEHIISTSVPSIIPDAAKEKLGTVTTTDLDSKSSVQLHDDVKSKTEVDSLQFDADTFGDILSEPVTSSARAGHKFRPKMKPQPRKDATRGIASALPDLTKSPTVVDSAQSPQSIHVGNCTRIDSIDSSLATADILGIKEPREHDTRPSSSISLSESTRSLEGGNPSQLHSTNTLQSDIAVPDGSEDWHSSFGKSLGETADIFLGLECLDDFIPQTTSGTGNDGSKSASKDDADVQHGEKFLSSFCVNNDLRGSISSSEMETHPVEGFGAQAHCSFESSEFTICDVGPPQTSSDRHTTQGPVTFSETAVSNKHVEVQVDNGSSETKAAGTFFDFETCETNVVSGQRAVKFQPKPKLGKGKEKPKTSDSQAEVRSSLPSEAAEVVSLNHELVQESSISEFPRKDALDCPSSRLGDMSYPTPEIQGDAEPTSFTEATHSEGAILDDINSEDGLRNVDGGTRTEEVSTESNCLRKSRRSSTTSEKVEDGKSSRQLRKRLKRTDDEPVDEGHDTDDPTYEPPSTSNGDEQVDNDDEYRVDTTSRKRKAPRKVKEPVTGNEKPVRRRKTSKKASDESAKEPPKTFSHSSRRNRRRGVDKALLDTPEDEIDPQRLPIRDLIILAEHRERMMIKDAAKLKTPQTNQSADNTLHESGSRNEEETLSEQGQCSDEDRASPKDQPNPIYFNYQTYMKKTPSTRWSKQETELFYEAVRQFGTDFSLIQQLFPNRTRHQVKLKFKKEERQHPLRLSEAATNRAKDHSHFESVIERLQQQAAVQAKQESYENDSAAVTGEEEVRDTATDNINDGAAKPPEKDNEVVEEQEAEVVKVHNSPLKSDESDGDTDMWNEYNF